MHSTHLSANETKENRVFVVGGHWVLIRSEGDTTVVTIGLSVPRLICVLMKEMLMRSARIAIATGQAVLLTIALVLSTELGWRLWKRWNPATESTSGPEKN